MATKPPRRTPERILETTLALFNQFGEPNVSTTLIATELSISPGNLYYHFPAKDKLVNALYEQYEARLNPVLDAAGDVRNVEDAWFFMHSLFELIWDFRFLYRDLNDLLFKNRYIELHMQRTLENLRLAMVDMLRSLSRHAHVELEPEALDLAATSMTVVVTYWLCFEYARNPRQAFMEAHVQTAIMRGASHALGGLSPYLSAEQRRHLRQLASAYQPAAEPEN